MKYQRETRSLIESPTAYYKQQVHPYQKVAYCGTTADTVCYDFDYHQV